MHENIITQAIIQQTKNALTIVQVANIQLDTLIFPTTTRGIIAIILRWGAIIRWRSVVVFTAAFGGAGA